ncbi:MULTISPECIES: DUF4232 domain-containing protein [unclassified Streptomyces]|uniref:DUF4232 domain-containing protein n=1 Tax=unclassified Streptomyces TaxID=2593676 RepID=UPI0004CC615B|nr:DUF4232 domain-containing protein [Streptomyces sp. NRRL F-2747]
MLISRTFATLIAAATTAVIAAAAGTAQAAAAGGAAPSACRPANHLAKIRPDQASSGHLHFRVTLTAPKGYASCRLAGSPIDVVFSNLGVPLGVKAGRYGDQTTSVTFGPGHPVHFDIQVPGQGDSAPADRASFTLRAPGGEIPGTSVAQGALRIAAGTVIGPVRSGA